MLLGAAPIGQVYTLMVSLVHSRASIHGCVSQQPESSSAMAGELTNTTLRRSPNSVANLFRLAALIFPLVNPILERVIAVSGKNLGCLGGLV